MKLDVPLPPEKQFVVVYQDADYREPDEPIYVHHWDDLLAQAMKSLASRREAYPAWIERGQITAEQAGTDIQAWEWIVAEWRWVITGEGELPPPASLRQRRDAVALSLQRIDDQLRRGNRTHDVYRQAHLAMALAWHLDRIRLGAPMIHLVAERNHARRRARAATAAGTSQQQRNAA